MPFAFYQILGPRLTQIVFSVTGGCPFHVYLEPLENQDPRRSRLKPLTLVTPPDAWLPLMDIDFTAPFRCLSVQSVLAIFALMLQVRNSSRVGVSCEFLGLFIAASSTLVLCVYSLVGQERRV